MTTITSAFLAERGYVVKDGKAVRIPPDELPDEADVTWQEMQRQCYLVFEEAGCEVYWLSQSRKPRQTPGLPDLIVFGPPGEPFHLAWETKAGRGALSEAQRKFKVQCDRTGFPHAAGGARMARRVLHELRKHSNDR